MRILIFAAAILLMVFWIALMAACTEIADDLPHPDELDKWEYFDRPGRTIISIFEDKDGYLWVGSTENGVSRYDGEKFETYDAGDGLIDNNVNAIAQDAKGTMWFGTPAGLSLLSNGGFTNISNFSGFSVEVSSLQRDRDDNIWVGTYNLGLWEETPQGLLSYWDTNCGECNVINTLYQDHKGQIWIGSDGDLKRYRQGIFTSYNKQDGISGSTVTSVFEDSWGSLWVGTLDGDAISRFSSRRFEEVSLSNSLPQNWVTSTTEDRNGNLWIGTVIGGLIKYDGLVMRTLFDDKLTDIIRILYTDQRGDIWIGTHGGGLVKHTAK